MLVTAQILSIIGAVIFFSAYLALSKKYLTIENPAYHWLVIISCFLLGISSIVVFNLGAIIINLVGIGIGIWNIRRKK